MKMQQKILKDVKVGDLLWNSSNWSGRSGPSVVTKITNSMVFSRAYRLMDGYNLVNSPESVDRVSKDLGLKGVKTFGDMYNGSASIPIAGNEHCLDLGVETKEKKTFKRRAIVRDSIALVIDPADASLEFDFYLN